MNANAILMVTTAFMWSCSLGIGAEYHRRTWWKDTQKPETSSESINKAVKIMLEADKSFLRFSQMISRAHWDWSVNITEENRKVKDKFSDELYEYKEKFYKECSKLQWKLFKSSNYTLFRWFKLACGRKYKPVKKNSFSHLEYESNNSTDNSSLSEYFNAEMIEIFSKAKFCSYKNPKAPCNLTIESGVKQVMATSRNPSELEYYWKKLREETGEKYKELFMAAIEKGNRKAKKSGYKDKAELRISEYEDKNFLENIATEVKKMMPLYREVHAYVRKKLIKFYKNETIMKDGPIPAHLLGNMYAQKWYNIYSIIIPYPNVKDETNITDAMLEKKMEPIDMFMMAENFFYSIGMKNMTTRFWKYSLMEKPKDGRVVNCHASAHNMLDGKDFRIKMCSNVDAPTLATVHHEMGHIEYFMHYSHLPFIFQRSPNPGFHEAIGDAITLSVRNAKYLKRIGLIKTAKTTKESTINFLMRMALDYAVSPFYAYIIDLWRNQVYNGTIKSNELNMKYWKYRLQYQGVCPPVRRTEKNFDIGAKYHIASDTEYWRYFVANILQFQIHESLCNEAGIRAPYHNCTIYKKKKAGKRLVKLLKMGRSQCWKKALKIFSRNKFNKLDASSLLTYFAPLMKWLKKQNKKAYKGWKSSDPMICPGRKDTTSNTDSTPVSTTKDLVTGTQAFQTSAITSSKLPTAGTISATSPTTGSTSLATGATVSTS